MPTIWKLSILAAALGATGCFLDRSGTLTRGGDAGPMAHDAAVMTDAGTSDAGSRDAGNVDAGSRDAGDVDAGARDAGDVDAGAPDGGDPCVGGPDEDGDGVPDACDVCPDGDDTVDLDGDGTPFDCDEWPCGAAPPTVPGTASGEWIEIDQVQVGDGPGLGNTWVVEAEEAVRLRFDWSIDDDGCGGCIDQIEVGLVPGGRLDCVYDANPPGGGASGSADLDFDAPATPGLVELRFNLGRRFDCDDDGNVWWDGEPPASHTFGVLCVTP